MKEKFKIGIFGSTGYTGRELVKILINHPQVELAFLGSNKHAGQDYAEIYPEFKEQGLKCVATDDNFTKSIDCDLVFFATPNGVAHKIAPSLIEKNIKVVDLSADYRFRKLEIYQEWYGFERKDQELNNSAIYGLVEFKRNEISKASLIGNPGCYTTSSILALAPVIKNKKFNPSSIIVDGKSGYSGAGREAVAAMAEEIKTDSVSSYKLANSHRHGPELEVFFQELSGQEIKLSFSPHLMPMFRGLVTTNYIELLEKSSLEELQNLYKDVYQDEAFVELVETNPASHLVSETNKAQIQINYDARLNRAIIVSAIDNLQKGAAGQAVQNMNLLLGLDESLSLRGL